MQMFTRGAQSQPGSGEETATTRWDCGQTTMPADLLPDDHAASLLRTIEAEIIPRLMLAHPGSSNDPMVPADPPPAPGPAQVARLTDLILHRDAASAPAYVRSLYLGGLPLVPLFLDLLGPVAQHLGAMWEADLCDFTQVTVGLWRLQQIVYEYSPVFQREARVRAVTRRAMLVPAPGSQHTFGVVIVAEFFRRAGWEVHGEPNASAASITTHVAREWFDLLGLSVGAECQVPAVASAILTLRKASLNPAMVVMVGGPVVPLVADFVARVGADGSAPDAAAAVILAENLVPLRAPPPMT